LLHRLITPEFQEKVVSNLNAVVRSTTTPAECEGTLQQLSNLISKANRHWVIEILLRMSLENDEFSSDCPNATGVDDIDSDFRLFFSEKLSKHFDALDQYEGVLADVKKCVRAAAIALIHKHSLPPSIERHEASEVLPKFPWPLSTGRHSSGTEIFEGVWLDLLVIHFFVFIISSIE